MPAINHRAIDGEGMHMSTSSPAPHTQWMRRLHAPNSWALGSVVVFLGTAFSRLLGFARELAMADLFGTSAATDAWLMASVIPNLLFSTVNAALANVVVPVLASRSPNRQDDDVVYVREMMALVTAVTVLLTVVGEIWSPALVHALAPGFGAGERARTVLLTRIMLPTIIFWAVAGLAMGVLQARAVYAPSSAAPVLVNVLRVATILVLGRLWGIVGVALGFLLAVAGQLAYLLPALVGQGFSLKPRWRVEDARTRETIRLTGPFLLTSAAGALGLVVDRILASNLPTGNIAALNYALLITQLPLGLLVNAVSLPGFTRLAEEWNADDRQLFRQVLYKTLDLTLFIAVPSALLLKVAAVPVVHLLYQRGAFGRQSTTMTAHILLFWLVGLPAFAAQMVLGRALFVLRAARVMVTFTVVTVAANVAGDLLLIRPLGAGGLALATGVAAWLGSGLSLWYLGRRRLLSDQLVSLRLLVRYGIAGAALAVLGPRLLDIVRPWFHGSVWAQVSGLALWGLVGAAAWVLAVGGLDRLWNRLRRTT
jgi:putative peptidoglycan lipid II flippase